MVLRVPSYYKKFSCIAGACRDSCCIGWEIDIDCDTFSYYKSVGGTFGRRFKEHMHSGEEHSFRLRENGWCPFLNEQKLCDICIELGEEALSEVCTEYPRFTLEYENIREKTLCLSCEEAGRLVFSSNERIVWEEQDIPDAYDMCLDGEESLVQSPSVSGTALAFHLEQIRAHAVEILQDRSRPIFIRACEYLSYCERMQQELSERFMTDDMLQLEAPAVWGEFQREKFLQKEPLLEESGMQTEAYQDFLERLEHFDQLETLNEEWTNEKTNLRKFFTQDNYFNCRNLFLKHQKNREYEYEHLLVYFTFRYFMRAYYDACILTKAQFAVSSVLMIRDMDVMRYFMHHNKFSLHDRVDTARIYAKEVEHSEENMELLAEDFQFEDIFCPARLRKQLLSRV